MNTFINLLYSHCGYFNRLFGKFLKGGVMLTTDKKQDQRFKLFDRKRIEKALASGKVEAPQGMSREEKRKFLSGK